MKTNKLREILNSGKTSMATRVESIWPTIVEMIGSTGFYDIYEANIEEDTDKKVR